MRGRCSTNCYKGTVALTESQAIDLIKEGLSAQPVRRRVRIGIGDDAAVFRFSAGDAVFTCDTCEEGAHFLRGWLSPEQLAQKAFHAALSDIPAMGARAFCATTHLTLTSATSADFLRRLVKRQAEMAAETGVSFVGGNVCFGSSLLIGTSVLGSVSGRPLLRSGARPGDELWVLGELGLARAGFFFLQRGARAMAQRSEAGRVCLEAFQQPVALIRQGPRLIGRATACMDVSDGLVRDVQSLAEASDVRVVIDEEALRAHLSKELMVAAALLNEDPLSLALVGGEDYALLATGPCKRRPRAAKVIGRVEAGKGAYLERSGKSVALRGGFEHRAKRW